MYRQNQALFNLLNPEVTALGYQLLGIELNQNGHGHGHGSGSILRLYIDKDDGVTIDDCVLVSQQLTGLLDVEYPIKGHYVLEVSSPGLDRPIQADEQFRKFIGQLIKLRLHRKKNGRNRYVGLLVSVNDELIIINCDDVDIEIPLSLIDTARLVPQF